MMDAAPVSIECLMTRLLTVLLAFACLVGCREPEPEIPPDPVPHKLAPLSVTELRARHYDTRLVYEQRLPDGPGYKAHLVSYASSGLKLHAMVAVPKTQVPAKGFPVVIANHGYVPDPTRYGITPEGVDSRPGDYYRSVPELYTSRGFLVVMPDFRGHNSSDGIKYISPQDDNSVAYYAEDVVALLSVLDDIKNADLDNVFMWSHSMGGVVAMRALLVTDIIKAASFWATMSVEKLQPWFETLNSPVMIQHSRHDAATEYANSEWLAATLESNGHSYTLHSYDSDKHYFEGASRELAANRDADFFRSFLQD